jgi:hypothetical protein
MENSYYATMAILLILSGSILYLGYNASKLTLKTEISTQTEFVATTTSTTFRFINTTTTVTVKSSTTCTSIFKGVTP